MADSQIQNWQLDIMMVNRLLRQYKSTIDNLKSLSEMLEIIGEITVEQEVALCFLDRLHTISLEGLLKEKNNENIAQTEH